MNYSSKEFAEIIDSKSAVSHLHTLVRITIDSRKCCSPVDAVFFALNGILS